VRAEILAARERLVENRAKLRRQHDSGSLGIQVCTRQSDFWDGTVLEIFESACAELPSGLDVDSQLALVPLGGYGRRDIAPYSDMDLMLLHDATIEQHVSLIARRLVADLSDVGIELGFSVRTPRQAIKMARRDPVIFTSEVEARYLAGSVSMVTRFIHRFRRDAKRRVRAILAQIERARSTERRQFGATTFLLEPDVKRTLGGLRDIHLLRWAGFARFGEPNPANLRLMGILRKEDERALRKAHEFLLRLRNELHFKAQRKYDVLNRGEQLRIAEKWGYTGDGSLRPVQQFMRDYFRHTSNVREIADSFMSNARLPSIFVSVLAPIVAHRMGESFLVGPVHIKATKEGLMRLKGNLSEVLRLMVLANQADKRIASETWKAIREDMMDRSEMEVSPEAARRFMFLLSYTARLGRLLQRLHELGVLEKLVAGMDHARYLLQFNQYHKYTVDEHSIQAVERATEFFSHSGKLGHVYRSIKQRNLLHLALLIHDLGKGYEEEHCIVGKRLAKETAKRLGLAPRRSRLLQFLVEKHLVMSHVAFRRDTSDPAMIHQFANDVGTPEALRMLYVLTAADLAAVGPGVLNPWKVDVLTSLYERTIEHLGGDALVPDSEHEAERLRMRVDASLPAEDTDWYRRQIRALPTAYLCRAKPHRVVKDLTQLRELKLERSVAWGRYSDSRRVNLYNVGLHQRDVHTVFHRLVGVLTQKGMQILAAHVYRLEDGLAFMQFIVEDHDFEGPPPQERFDVVAGELMAVILDQSDISPSLRRVWRSRAERQSSKLQQLPILVEFDNNTLPEYTIIDIFAHDRVDLMYTITRVLFGLGVHVHFIKSGPSLDQVVDVFYVTDSLHNKIEDDRRLSELRLLLLTAVESG
jgi:[protein-PII] uridylyltransferase